jgi:hypothetical protein
MCALLVGPGSAGVAQATLALRVIIEDGDLSGGST